MSNPLQFMEDKCGSIYRMKQVLVHSTREQDDNARTANQRHVEFWHALREQTGKNIWVHGNANPNLSQPEFERLRAIWNFASLRVIHAATRGRALDMLVRDKRVTGVYERQRGAA